MLAFNTWYYSFSPSVANYLGDHSIERSVMRVVLYPLVGILYLTSNLYARTSAFPELAILLSGLLASSLIGAFYLGIPLTIIRSKTRGVRKLSTLKRYLSVLLLAAVTMLVVGELTTSTTILMISSTSIVLSTMLLSALVTSSKIAKKLNSFQTLL
jgi:peptide/nickel transport system substrate-binding protein